MPAVVRLGDLCSGHACWPSRPNIEGSPNVFVNGKPMHRVTDGWAVHCCEPGCHAGVAAAGSATVFCNGLPVFRVGDPVSCGSVGMEGSPNVFCNS